MKADRIRLIGVAAASSSHPSLRFALAASAALAGVAGIGTTPSARDLGIRQYKPTSTLRVPQHPVARARSPVIDIHSHHRRLSPQRWAAIVREMDEQNLQILVNLIGGTGDELAANMQAIATRPAPDHMMFFANLDYADLDTPGYVAREYPHFWRTFEIAGEYFDYCRDDHAFWKLYGLDLPDQVLRKVYYANALRLVPRLSAAPFPPAGAEAMAAR